MPDQGAQEADLPVPACTLPAPAGQVGPGERLAIAEKWMEDELCYLRLQGADGVQLATYSVRWIVKRPDCDFVVLQVPDDWWDPDEQAAPQSLLKVVNRKTLSTIRQEELEKVLPHLRSLWQQRQNWAGPKLYQKLALEVREIFGELAEQSSFEPDEGMPRMPPAER